MMLSLELVPDMGGAGGGVITLGRRLLTLMCLQAC